MNTKAPWAVGLAAALLLLTACESTPTAVASSSSAPMMWRTFPQESLRGDMEFSSVSEIRINGKPARLSPGARVRGENNMVQFTQSLVGQKTTVNYTMDAMGLVHEVWLLTAAERRQGPWPSTKEQAQAWQFNPATQSWSRP